MRVCYHTLHTAQHQHLAVSAVTLLPLHRRYTFCRFTLYRFIKQALFPDNTYGVDSGGDPAAIPSLTFDYFKNFHTRFYHPANARIYFYGDDPVPKRLELLDEVSCNAHFCNALFHIAQRSCNAARQRLPVVYDRHQVARVQLKRSLL
jgi:hypothetical protein